MTASSNVDVDVCQDGVERGRADLFALFLAVFAVLFWLSSQVILDDAYIYLRVSETLAGGGGPRFNADDPKLAVTSPLWLVMLAGVQLLAPAIAPVLLAKTLFLLALVAASLLLFDLLRAPFPLAATLAPVVVFFSPLMLAFTGLDVALALATGLAVVWCYERDALAGLAVAAALCYLARGEGAVLGAGLWLAAILREGWGAAAQRLQRATPGIALAIVMLGVWHVYYALTFGAVFPGTLEAKILQGRPPASPFYRHAIEALDHVLPGVWAAPLLVLGAMGLGRRVWPLLAWPFVHYGVYALLRVANYSWYFYPVYVVGTLCLLVSLDVLRGRSMSALSPHLPPFRRRRFLTRTTLLLGVGLGLAIVPQARRSLAVEASAAARQCLAGEAPAPPMSEARFVPYPQLADWTRRRFAASEEIAGWLEARLRSWERPVLLAPDIGLLGYLLPGFDVKDTYGLTGSLDGVEQLPDWQVFVDRYRPDYLVPLPTPLPRSILEGGEWIEVFVPSVRYFHSAVWARTQEPLRAIDD